MSGIGSVGHREARREAPGAATADRDHATLLAELAAGLATRGFPDAAAIVLNQALAIDPSSFAARFGSSELLRAGGRADEALALAWEAYETVPSRPGLAAPLAEQRAAQARLRQQGPPPENASVLASAVGFAATQRPREAWLAELVARLHRESGKPAEAVVWYRRAAAIDPAFADRVTAAAASCPDLPPVRLTAIEDGAALRDALRRVTLPTAKELVCEPLTGGVQNRVVKLTAGTASFALRLEKYPSDGWFFYAEEANNAVAAHRAGVAPSVRYFDQADGTQLTDFIAGPMLTVADFAVPARAAEAGALYRRLHAIEGFRGTYEIFSMIEGDRAKRGDFRPPELADLAQLDEAVMRLRRLLEATRGALRATHNDPIPQNFIAGPDGLVLLDWQCAALGDPHWELGAFGAQAALHGAAEDAFVAAYFDADDAIGRARYHLFKPVCSFFWIGRALIRGARSSAKSSDETWREDALDSARRLRELIVEPVHAESIAVLEARTTPA
jgi:thiamine kinase-like enzyme